MRIRSEFTASEGRPAHACDGLDLILGNVLLGQEQEGGLGNGEGLQKVLTIEPRTFEYCRDLPIDPIARYPLEHPVPCDAEADVFRRPFLRSQYTPPELVMAIGLVQRRRCQLSKCVQPPLVDVYHLPGLQYEDGGTITGKGRLSGRNNVRKGAPAHSAGISALLTAAEKLTPFLCRARLLRCSAIRAAFPEEDRHLALHQQNAKITERAMILRQGTHHAVSVRQAIQRAESVGRPRQQLHGMTLVPLREPP